MAETGTVRIGRPKQLLLISFSIFHAPEIGGPLTERIFDVLTNAHHTSHVGDGVASKDW